jgi:arylsulfatase A-like enzyme
MILGPMFNRLVNPASIRSRILLASTLALASCLHARAEPVARPNILLILSDDHSAEFVGCYGNPDVRTPNLDRLAAQGLRFDRAYTHPQCVPSRATIMTGRSPVSVGMARFSAPLPREHLTFFEPLRAKAGYAGAVIGRHYHLDGSHGQAAETRESFAAHRLVTFPERVDFLQINRRADTPRLFAQFLDQVRDNRPFVAQVGFDDPHRAFTAPKVHDPATLTVPPDMPDTPTLRQDLAEHYDEIHRLDGDIGVLLAMLEERGMTDNTLVVFMGDNGSAMLRGKGTLFERGIRVPLIARWPGVIAPGRVSNELVSSEELAPTFLAAGGLPPVSGMTGRDLGPLLRDTPFVPRSFAVIERGAHSSSLPLNSSAFDLGRTVVTARYKLIYNALWQLPYAPVDMANTLVWADLKRRHTEGQLPAHFNGLFASNRPMFQLYDLATDPLEATDLIDDPAHAEIARSLKATLQDWMIVNRDFIPLPIPPVQSPSAPPDAITAALPPEFQSFNQLFNGTLAWMIELYDPERGGFHENVAMARAPEKYTPHIQATGMVLHALERSGLMTTMPDRVRASLVKFIQSNYDQKIGRYWDRAYPKTIEGARADRNLARVDGFARNALKRLGEIPKGDADSGKAAPPPANLATIEAWKTWLRERLGDSPNYRTLDDLSAHADLLNQLPAAQRTLYIDTAVAYVNPHQDATTGLWDNSLDATFKYLLFLVGVDRPIPHPERIRASILNWFDQRTNEIVDNTCFVCNPVRMLPSLVERHPELALSRAEVSGLAAWHTQHLEAFLHPEGGFSRWLKRFPLAVLDSVQGQSPGPQADVNGHAQTHAARSALYKLLAQAEPPLPKAEGFWDRFMKRHFPSTP